MQPRLLAVAAAILVPAGLLVAAETPRAAVPETKAPETVTVTFLGVMAVPAGPALEKQLGLPAGVGMLVEGVVPDSPAAKGGIMRFDVLGRFDDQLLIDLNQLRTLVNLHKSGDAVKITFYRNGKADTAAITLATTEIKGNSALFFRDPARRAAREKSLYFMNGDTPRHGRHMGRMESRTQAPVKGEAEDCGCGAATPAAPATPTTKPAASVTPEALLDVAAETPGESSYLHCEALPSNALLDVTTEAPSPGPLTSMNVGLATKKYAVTVEYKNGMEFATVKTADGKSVCKDLPRDKWDTLPQGVQGMVSGIHLDPDCGHGEIQISP